MYKIFLALFLVLLIVAGCNQFYDKRNRYEQGQQPGSSALQSGQATAIEEMATWKSYRNEAYGFELQYPSRWVVVSDNNESITIHEKSQIPAASIASDGLEAVEEIRLNISIAIWPTETLKRLQDEVEHKSNIVINSLKALRETNADRDTFKSVSTTLIKDNTVFRFTQDWSLLGESNLAARSFKTKNEAFKTLDHILATLQFTR